MKAVPLKGPNKETVRLIEEFLKNAKSGEVQDFIAITFNREATISTAFTDGLSISELCFGLKCLELRVNQFVEKNKEIVKD